jgi:hypothetical protein
MPFEFSDLQVNNVAPSPISRFSELVPPIDLETVILYYSGPNIRAFLYQNGIDPSLWRTILEYNRINSVVDLVSEVTPLEIPRIYVDQKFSIHPDA